MHGGIFPHVGVFIDGRVLHLSDNGVEMTALPILELQFSLSFFQ
jgi:hypothetical protein